MEKIQINQRFTVQNLREIMKNILVILGFVLVSNIAFAKDTITKKTVPDKNKPVVNLIRPPQLNYAAICQMNDALNAENVTQLLREQAEGRLNAEKYLSLAKIYYYGIGEAQQNKLLALQYAGYAASIPSTTAKLARRTLANWRLKALKIGDEAQKYELQKLIAEMQRDDLYEAGYFAGQMAEIQGDYTLSYHAYRSVLKQNPRANLALAALYYQEKLPNPKKTKVAELITMAQKLFLAELNKGDCTALMPLADMFLNGEAMEPMPNIGAQWLQASLSAGYGEAGVRLGLYYSQGKMVEKSDAMARKWWNIAAETGSKRAMFLLAKSLLTTSEKADKQQAIMWLERAKKLNYSPAEQLLNEMQKP
jgi:TPR repeat protein